MRWIVVICYSMMIVTVPGGAIIPPGAARIFGIDKVIHFIVYALLCFLVCRALTATMGRELGRTFLVLAFLMTVLYGIFDEVRQLSMPTRCASIYDIVADTLGALTTVIVWPKATRRWRGLMM